MTTDINKIINELIDIYHRFELWHIHKLDRDDSYDYFLKLLAHGNIILCEIDDKIVGYVEFWNVNYEQFGRLLCGENLSPSESKTDGNICYVANTYIHKEYRNTGIVTYLKNEFFKRNHHCDYYVGEARRKKTGLVKVFKKSELKSSLFTIGERHGKG